MFSRISVFSTLIPRPLTQLQQTRNTIIVKRRFPICLVKKNHKPKNFKERQYVYDFVKDTSVEKMPDFKVILTTFVSGFGFKGDVVTVRPNVARYKLLLPKLAVYASPENIEKYAKTEESKSAENKATLSGAMTAVFLSKSIVAVTMNIETPWILEKWHVKVGLRKAGIFVPDHAIELPQLPIEGPNPELEGKMFLVTVTINGLQKVIVRCRIHHWTTDVTKIRTMNMIYISKEVDYELIFPEDEEIVKTLPLPPWATKNASNSQPLSSNYN